MNCIGEGKMRGLLLAGSAVGALIATPAWGQASAPAPAGDQAQVNDQAGASSSSEIIVTAQKRSERLEDVPISITAVSGAQVEKAGVTNLTDVGQLTVGVNFTNNGPQIQPTIRGVTSLTGSIGQDNNVAIYVDGVYQASSTTLNQELIDIKSVQILKGPQGTLFGRNATAGAILVETLDPEFDWSGKVRLSYGRFNDVTAGAYLTGPLVKDLLAFNITGYYRQNDGFSRDIFDRFNPAPLKDYSVRSKVLFQPADNLKFILAGEFAHVQAPWTTAYLVPTRNVVAYENPGTVYATQPWTLSLDKPNGHLIERHDASLTAEWDLGFAKLKSITAFSNDYSFGDQDGDGTAIPRSYVKTDQDIKALTEEVNLGGKTGRLDWVLGGFYFHQNADVNTYLAGAAKTLNTLGPIIGPISQGARPRAWAVFADGTLQVTDRLAVIAGIRYSWERKSLIAPNTTTNPAAATASLPYLPDHMASKTWHSITPRFSLRYEVAPNTNVYASYSQGFKSGAYGSTLPTIANPAGGIPAYIAVSNPADPEKADAFEIGFKTAQHGWRFNVAAFYEKYKNLQVQTSSLLPPPAPPLLVTQLTNAASSKIYGLEVSGSADLTDHLTVSAGVGWTHARYESFTGAQAYGLCPLTPQTVNGVTSYVDATGFVRFTGPAGICVDTSTASNPAIPAGYNTRSTGLMDRSGDQMLRSPDWTANFMLDYTLPTHVGEFGFNVAANYSSSYGLNDLTPVGIGDRYYRFAQPAYVMINAEISLVPAFDPDLKFTLWGRNLANEVTYISGLGNAGDRYIVGPPRTYGVQIDAKF